MSITNNGGSDGDELFRVLSLDGGGIKGTFTAAALTTLEEVTGKRIVDHFDLVVGTSTGGIIAIALGLGVPAEDILGLYINHGPSIFPPNDRGWKGWIAENWRHIRQPKHSQSTLAAAIDSVIGDQLFGESTVRLVIPAFNAVSGGIHLFKTGHHPKYKLDPQLPAKTVAMATSAAPTYFPSFGDGEGRVFLDGGVWANCPAMVGLIEATKVLSRSVDQIEMLSIGTTNQPFDVSHKRRFGGLARWNKGLVDLLMEAQVGAVLGQVNLLMDGRLVRMDQTTRAGRFSLDNSSEINDLRGLGEQAARAMLPEIEDRFFNTKAKPFVNPAAQIAVSSA